MTEDEFSDALVELAHLFDWKVAGFRPARTKHGWRTAVRYDGKGFPDLTLVHPNGSVIFAELKADKGRMSPEQVEWQRIMELAARYANGVRHVVWRPRDASDIAAVLSFGRITDWTV